MAATDMRFSSDGRDSRAILSAIPLLILGVAGGQRNCYDPLVTPRPVCSGFAMITEQTTAVVQRYLQALAGDQPAETIVRALLDRSVRRLQVLGGNLLHR